MKLNELREIAKSKGCLGVGSMNKSQLSLYIESGIKYRKNQIHVGEQTENSECNECAFETLKKKLEKEAEKIRSKKKRKNTIDEDGVLINVLNGEVLGYTIS